MENVKYLILLAKVYQRVDRIEDAQNMFTKGRDMQARVLKRVQMEAPDTFVQQKQLAAE
jgi:tetratricopeptide repeat protein 21B